MPNWKQVAAGWSLDIPEDALERITPALDALTRDFRPLKQNIPHETEPAVVMQSPPEAGQ